MPSKSEAKSFFTNGRPVERLQLGLHADLLQVLLDDDRVSFTVWFGLVVADREVKRLPSLASMPSDPGLKPASASSALARFGS